MPRQSDRFIIGKQLLQLIELEILDSDSSSSSDSDLELLDMLSSDSTSTDSSGNSDRGLDFDEDSESDRDEDVADLIALADAVEQSRYLTRGLREHSVFHNDSGHQQAPVFVQLAVALDRFGH
ncbi:hypothetical protein R1sor_002619 [Riccia sorocarpa]|uniref:Uncharacterized protein n=1 Tax=Riccia sorocarpa TaxID=122646 RepID=A0ABD3H1Y3_9MARC